MRPFTAAVGCLLAVVLTVNGLAALDRWHRAARLREVSAALRPGRVMAFDGVVDERRLQEARLRVIPRPRVVAFGSSRVRDVSSQVAHAGPAEFYNLGMSGAVVEDYIALWSLLKRDGKIPAVAVFSVDAWVLSRTQEHVAWVALAPEVSRFLEAAGARHGPAWTGARDLAVRWLEAKELLSYAVLVQSIRDLDRALSGRRRQGDDLIAALAGAVVPEDQIAGRQGIRADGSVIRAAAPAGATPARGEDEAAEFVAGGAYALKAFRWDPGRAADLELLWRDMRAHGVQLYAYAPPYRPATWALLVRQPEYVAALDTSAAFLGSLAGRVGARFVDFSDPASVPCGEDEFYDAHHPKPSCLERIWSRLLR